MAPGKEIVAEEFGLQPPLAISQLCCQGLSWHCEGEGCRGGPQWVAPVGLQGGLAPCLG